MVVIFSSDYSTAAPRTEKSNKKFNYDNNIYLSDLKDKDFLNNVDKTDDQNCNGSSYIVIKYSHCL